MSRTKEQDVKIGKEKEQEVLPHLKRELSDKKLKIVEEEYSRFDFESPSKRVELKFRNNTSHKYQTTMISLSKVYDAEKYEGEFYFCFYFTDKFMLIKYDKEQFKKYERKIITRNDRGLNESNTYVLIDVDDLTEIKV